MESAALSYAVKDSQEWAEYTIKRLCNIAADEIMQLTIAKCMETGLQIPNTKEAMVDMAFEQGWAKTAARRHEEASFVTGQP